MYKIIDSSFFDEEEPQISILDTSKVTLLTKAAVDSRISQYVKNISPVPGKIYLHINAMGAGEYFGPNKNGDYFPEKNLLEYYKTFETSPAHVFRHHVNKDPAKSIGKVLFAVYNQRMHRVELIAEVDRSLGADIESKIASGQYPSTSMACRTPFDECSICGNRAKTRQEYCTHLTSQLGTQLPDGRKVMAMNIGPLNFFDISIVIRPADITSSILEKVANRYGSEIPKISSVKKAEVLGFVEDTVKQAAVKKVAELTKIIQDSGHVMDTHDKYLGPIVEKVEDLPEYVVDHLSQYDFVDVIHGLAESGISPSLTTLGEILARNVYKEEGVGMGEIIGYHAKTSLLSGDVDTSKFFEIEGVEKQASVGLIKIALKTHRDKCSIFPEFIEKRAAMVSETLPQYVMEPTNIMKTKEEEPLLKSMVAKPLFKNILEGEHEAISYWKRKYPMSILKTLGDLVIAAKIYINNLMNKGNDAKILIEKTAEAIFVNEVYSPTHPPKMKAVRVPTKSTTSDPSSINSTKTLIKAIKSINATTVRNPTISSALRLAKTTAALQSKLTE